MTENDNDLEEADRILPKSKSRHGNCVICSEKAEFCIRGIPEDCYCKECAEECFQSLEDLDKF